MESQNPLPSETKPVFRTDGGTTKLPYDTCQAALDLFAYPLSTQHETFFYHVVREEEEANFDHVYTFALDDVEDPDDLATQSNEDGDVGYRFFYPRLNLTLQRDFCRVLYLPYFVEDPTYLVAPDDLPSIGSYEKARQTKGVSKATKAPKIRHKSGFPKRIKWNATFLAGLNRVTRGLPVYLPSFCPCPTVHATTDSDATFWYAVQQKSIEPLPGLEEAIEAIESMEQQTEEDREELQWLRHQKVVYSTIAPDVLNTLLCSMFGGLTRETFWGGYDRAQSANYAAPTPEAILHYSRNKAFAASLLDYLTVLYDSPNASEAVDAFWEALAGVPHKILRTWVGKNKKKMYKAWMPRATADLLPKSSSSRSTLPKQLPPFCAQLLTLLELRSEWRLPKDDEQIRDCLEFARTRILGFEFKTTSQREAELDTVDASTALNIQIGAVASNLEVLLQDPTTPPETLASVKEEFRRLHRQRVDLHTTSSSSLLGPPIDFLFPCLDPNRLDHPKQSCRLYTSQEFLGVLQSAGNHLQYSYQEYFNDDILFPSFVGAALRACMLVQRYLLDSKQSLPFERELVPPFDLDRGLVYFPKLPPNFFCHVDPAHPTAPVTPSTILSTWKRPFWWSNLYLPTHPNFYPAPPPEYTTSSLPKGIHYIPPKPHPIERFRSDRTRNYPGFCMLGFAPEPLGLLYPPILKKALQVGDNPETLARFEPEIFNSMVYMQAVPDADPNNPSPKNSKRFYAYKHIPKYPGSLLSFAQLGAKFPPTYSALRLPQPHPNPVREFFRNAYEHAEPLPVLTRPLSFKTTGAESQIHAFAESQADRLSIVQDNLDSNSAPSTLALGHCFIVLNLKAMIHSFNPNHPTVVTTLPFHHVETTTPNPFLLPSSTPCSSSQQPLLLLENTPAETSRKRPIDAIHPDEDPSQLFFKKPNSSSPPPHLWT